MYIIRDAGKMWGMNYHRFPSKTLNSSPSEYSQESKQNSTVRYRTYW